MAGKRGATSDLNHLNWNNEETPEEAGTFKRAADDIIKNRVIKTAKRRNPISSVMVKYASIAGNQSAVSTEYFKILKKLKQTKLLIPKPGGSMEDKERLTSVTTTENQNFVTDDKSNSFENISLSQDPDVSHHSSLSQRSVLSQHNIHDITPTNSQLDCQDILQSIDVSQPSTSQQANHSLIKETTKRKKKTIKAKEKSSTQPMIASSTLMNYLLEDEKNKKCEANNKDEIDLFF